SMENIRIHLFENQGVFENAKAEVSLKKIKIIVIILTVLIIFCLIFSKLYINKDYLLALCEDVELELTDDNITLSFGQEFHPMDYVKSYNKENKLILPATQEMNKLTDYEYIYEVDNGVKSIQKTLIVTVIDDQPPVIQLKQRNVTIIQDDDFDVSDYITDVSDNYDNLSLEDIHYEINGDVSQVGNFTVSYSVTDSSGNETSNTLNVKVEQKSEVQTQSNSNNNQKASDIAKKQNKINNGLPSTKIFYIRDYNYNIEACKNAAVSYMNDQLNKSNATYGELQPYQENNTTVGYKVLFQ
ncbi:MAG: HYR domain-containing protein, partial [Thomasclavelia ramosa]|nr:HYR domain-containing protein [Thomasclavelia ramosa]